jgi:hypothetical protein
MVINNGNKVFFDIRRPLQITSYGGLIEIILSKIDFLNFPDAWLRVAQGFS